MIYVRAGATGQKMQEEKREDTEKKKSPATIQSS
jgi:hypothetical protein